MNNVFKWTALFALAVSFLALPVVSCGDDDDDDDNDDDSGGNDDDDDQGETFSSCDETSTVLSGVDDESDLLGISAGDVLDEAGGGFTATAAYAEDTSILTQSPLGGETELTVTIAYDGGEIREVESVPVEGGAEIAADCRHRIEIEVSIGFATDDGAFDENWSGVLSQSLAPEGGFDAPLLAAAFDPFAVEGSFEIVSIEGPEPDAVTGALYTTAADPVSGTLNVYVEQSSGDGPDGTVSQAQHTALSW
ncbi:MAG: hypothetical protein M5R36_15635 [Deltaproteobacteria bacterium]|nr:hypothetical protein [Deltaproteobacteria bacterium]